MATAPNNDWDIVFGATASLIQQVANKNFSTNSELNSVLVAPPTISLNSSNQIVFDIAPQNYTGTYSVALDLAAISVTPIANSGTNALLPKYQMCFAEVDGQAPFTVTVGEGGSQESASAIQGNLNQSATGQCFPIETNVRRDKDGIEVGANVQALLNVLSPQYMAFASLVNASGGAVDQLLIPVVSDGGTQPSESPFDAFSGSTVLDIGSSSAGSNSLYSLWDYFFLDSMVKPKLADAFNISENSIMVSSTEPAVLTVNTPISLSAAKRDSVTLNNFTVQFVSNGIQIQTGFTVKNSTVIASIPLSASVNGSMTLVIAETLNTSGSSETVGLQIVSLDASMDSSDQEIAKFVSLRILEAVYHAFDKVNPGPPLSQIYFLIALLAFLIVDVFVLAALSIAGEDPSSVTDKMKKQLNDRLSEFQRTLNPAVSIDEVVYDLGTIDYLTLNPDQFQ